MENRERDRVSKRTTPTEAGDINRQTSQEQGREKSGTGSSEFGENIGRSENLGEEGDNMNKDKTNKPNFDEESSRRPSDESGYGSSSGRSGSMGDVERGSDLNKNQGQSEIGSRRGSSSDSSEREH